MDEKMRKLEYFDIYCVGISLAVRRTLGIKKACLEG
jgi:hypothetical protein